MLKKTLVAMTIAMCLLALPTTQARQKTDGGSSVTAQDRGEIERLVARYASALGLCSAGEYAGLFTPDGFFASGPRGKVEGRKKLIALVQSERHCSNPDKRPLDAPTVAIEPSAGGATGKASLNSGYYADVYVKTRDGWRFKSRSFISAKEAAANLTARDFEAIRELAGGPYGDLYLKTPEGWRFRSSGIVIEPASEGAAGRAYLRNDDGYYEDVYVKASGRWRFQSRTYVPAQQASAGGVSASQRVE